MTQSEAEVELLSQSKRHTLQQTFARWVIAAAVQRCPTLPHGVALSKRRATFNAFLHLLIKKVLHANESVQSSARTAQWQFVH